MKSIKVSEATHRKLTNLKKELNCKTIESLIQMLVEWKK